MHLLRSFRPVCVSACLALTSAITASATLFDYQYTFANGLIVSGSFEGTQAGNEVHGISNVTLSFNGVEVPGPIQTFQYLFPTGWAAGGGIISFDAAENNFLFHDTVAASGFYLLDLSDLYGPAFSQAFAADASGASGYESPVNAGSWSLVARAAVPDAAATGLLLASGFAALALGRRVTRHSPSAS